MTGHACLDCSADISRRTRALRCLDCAKKPRPRIASADRRLTEMQRLGMVEQDGHEASLSGRLERRWKVRKGGQ